MTASLNTKAPDVMSGAYRAVWRWHFYAGVLVMPFLMLLTLTGGLYLFKDEIDHAVYRSMIQVPASAQQADPDQWLAAAARAGEGRAANILIPARADQAVRVRVDRPDGAQRTVFVDPHTAKVTGVTAYGGATETIKKLHSLSLFGGPIGTALNILVEIVAGWAVILCATGLYLWWPRRRAGAVLKPSESDARRRPFWRDVHALTGFYVGGVVIFLAVTGMPWSAVWGDRFMDVMRGTGLGRPPAPAAASPWSHAKPHDAPAGVGWTLENAVLPAQHHGHGHGVASLTRVLETAQAQALPRPFTVSIPQSPDLAWTVSRQTRKAQDARSLYVDGTSGAVKADLRWSQFGVMAKGFEWGIAVHQGIQYGWINRIVMLIGCIAVWLLAISGLIMWWKRRPPSLSRRRTGAPPAPPGPRARIAVLCIVIPLSILYPLTGLSLVAALLLDRAVRAFTGPKPVAAS
ncbi:MULTISPECIES: PepSY domain-containing protein [Brevundimonas]|uniref:PepSY-associated TM helix domain-containing protein n=1 Tax=Brevundimonas sp. 357 TaxID=2555782 RepID=UPI000F7A0865|nr:MULTISPECIES: PepSY domain-containing protein [Brevundimonas]RSB47521.1 PepSY domain-containing protein [Brevundimonas sp. 357]